MNFKQLKKRFENQEVSKQEFDVIEDLEPVFVSSKGVCPNNNGLIQFTAKLLKDVNGNPANENVIDSFDFYY